MGAVVYVVDNDASVRDALCRLATSAGFDARPFSDLHQFMAQSIVGSTGCVLLDASERTTGVPSGSPLAWQSDIPVIVLSATGGRAARRRARACGARFFLNKPVDAQALFDAIAWVSDETEPGIA